MTNIQKEQPLILTIAGHGLTGPEIDQLCFILGGWVNKLDTTGEYSRPNGALWNAVGNIVRERKAKPNG